MENDNEKNKVEIFFPYYINQSRLLDIYAIINGGYSEYSEITSALNSESTIKGSAEGSFKVGFKVLNLGGGVSGEVNKGQTNVSTEKKVQTVTSVLSIVKETLKNKGYLQDIKTAKEGQFICIPVTLSINSVKALMNEMQDIFKLLEEMSKANIDVKHSSKDLNRYKNLINAIKIVFEGEEILYETEDFAIIGNIYDSNLYQATRSDIIGTKLNCLAQVKRIYPYGTQLLKNSTFTKLKDASAKNAFIESFTGITKNDLYDFESVAVSSIEGKPVYQIEIIALYQ